MTTESPRDTVISQASDQRAVTTFIQLLAGAVKHHSLYPEDHSIARQQLEKIFSTLNSFLQHHNVLHLDVKKTTLIYDDAVVYQGRTDDKDIAFLLGRDGVEWLEFFKDIEQEELQSLLRIITNNRRNDIDQDGNIATALWEQDFPHLEYKTIDLTAMDIPLLNFSSFRVAPDPETEDAAGDAAGRDAHWQDYYSPEDATDFDEGYQEEQEISGLALTSPETALWQLTGTEQLEIDTLINKEESGIDTESTIEILLILLLLQNDQQEAVDIMDFLQDRFLYCLQHHEFKNGLKILGTLHKIQTTENKRQQQLSPLITELFDAVSRPESLRDLEKFFSTSDLSIQDKALEPLWSLLRLLPPDVLKGLAPMSEHLDLQRFGPAFLSLFQYFGELDPQNLAAVARQINHKICLHLFPFLTRIRMDQAVPVLSALSLHPSALVRGKAFQLLAEWEAVDVVLLFPLLDDPDEQIRRTMLSLIGRQRDPALEQLLCAHLQEHTEITDRDHIIACYHALGRVGSPASIPFLKKSLMEGSRLGTLFATGGGAHKEGAARALLGLRNSEAKKIVKEGATSMIPDVRAACRKALGARHA